MNNEEGITKQGSEEKEERAPTEDSLSSLLLLLFLSPSHLSQKLILPDGLPR